jgi:hypothetical protein
MFSPKNWWNIWPTGLFEEGHAAGVPGQCQEYGAVGRVVGQGAEERRRQRVQVAARLAHDVARDELRRVLVHVDEAVQFAQHVVGDVAAGPRLAVQEDRDLGVAVADLADEGTQLGDGLLLLVGQFLVVDRQDEGRGAALLLGERRSGRHSW